MKVVCTVTNDLHQDQRMDRICTTLARAGHDVTLVGRVRPNSLPLVAKPYHQHRISCRFNAGKLFYLEYNYRLVRTLRSWTCDVICAVDADTLAAGALLKRLLRAKLVFDAHEWFHRTPEVTDRPAVRAFWRGLVRRCLPATDLRYTVAPRLALRLEQDYGRPFATVRNLPLRSALASRLDVGPPNFQPATAPHKKIILYQGMLNPGRGLQVAIRAMAALPECELWLAGSGPEEGVLRRCSEEMGGAERVKWLGFVAAEDLPQLTRQAWLGINLLAATSDSYYYSLANKALDYIQAGVPSVQMDYPEYRYLYDKYHCYALCPELAVDAYANTVRELLDAPESYAALQTGCLRAARDLVWEREERVLLDLWAGLGD